MPTKVPAHDALYRALADRTRRILMDELQQRQDQSLFQLTTKLLANHNINSTRQAVSQHLTVLERAGLVHSRRDGRTKLHRFDPTPLRAIHERWPM